MLARESLYHLCHSASPETVLRRGRGEIKEKNGRGKSNLRYVVRYVTAYTWYTYNMLINK
jgi:hypothetical protein